MKQASKPDSLGSKAGMVCFLKLASDLQEARSLAGGKRQCGRDPFGGATA